MNRRGWRALVASLALGVGLTTSGAAWASTPSRVGSAYSPTYCANIWRNLKPSVRAQLGPKKAFVKLCVTPNFKRFLCDYDPTLPSC
jgi:hypothetical protein